MSDDATPLSLRHVDGEIITDVTRIRALSHPTRLALLDFLSGVEDATATQAAAAIGESVASCSFHLRSLAQHGYVEEAPRRGREKPWRSTATSWSQAIDHDIPGSAQAVSAVAEVQVRRQAARIVEFLGALPRLPDEYADSATTMTSSVFATPEELVDLRAGLTALLEPLSGRWRDPSKRPAGSQPAHVFTAINLDLPTEPPASRPPAASRES